MAIRDLAVSILITARNRATSAFSSLNADIRATESAAGGLQSRLSGAMDNIKTAIASAFAIAGITAFIEKLTNAVRIAQDLRTQISGLTTSNTDYAATEAYLVDLVGRHHKELTGQTKSYASLLALEQASIITRQQAIQILVGFSNAQTKTGASATQLEQSTYGLAQALGTGIVAMEEFKQITEPMPGLAKNIADAFGLTVGQLRQLIATGTVASAEFGQKFIIALQAYEGAAERTAGNVSASYADIANAYTAMAKELEKPVAAGAISVVDVGKSAYGWIKDNGPQIIMVLKGIIVLLAGNAASAIATYVGGKLSAINVERAHNAALIENARRTVAAAEASLVAAQSSLALSSANTAQARSNAALVQSDIRAESATLSLTNATIARARAAIAALSATVQTTSITHILAQTTAELTASETARAASIARLAALGQQQAAVTAEITAAQTVQIAASHAAVAADAELVAANIALAESAAASGVVMSRAAKAASAAYALIGGPVGVAIIALYGVYTAFEKIYDVEAKAERKAKNFTDALALARREIDGLTSEQSVDIDYLKTLQNIDDVRAKIKSVEQFSFSKLFNVGATLAQRQNLEQALDVLIKRKELLVGKKNDVLINFDATTLTAQQAAIELANTRDRIAEMTASIAKNKQAVADGLLDSGAINAQELELNALNAKYSALSVQTGATVQSQTALKKAFSDVQDSTKALTAQLDADTKLQSAVLANALTERLAAIDAMAVAEADKARLRLSAQLDAAAQEQALEEHASAAKLALIDAEYFREQTANAENAKKTTELEAQKRQAKLAVYSNLAEFYQGEIQRLTSVYASEHQAAADANKQLLALNKDHELALFEIKLAGLNDRQKLSAQERKFAETMRMVQTEQSKGEAADQQKINDLLDRARGLHSAIGTSSSKSSSAISAAKRRETELYDAQVKVLTANAEAHESNAARAKAAQQGVQAQLAATNKTVSDITTALNKDYALMVGVEPKAFAVVKAAIDDLTKPETKVITIKTVSDAPSGQPAGGVVQSPARFSTGGFMRIMGRLPGFGGGDRRRALLEDGEYVVRKEAVAALGVGALNAINRGELPDAPIKRASGGLVSDDEILSLLEKRKQAADVSIIEQMLNNEELYAAIGRTSLDGVTLADAQRNMLQQLQLWHRQDLQQYIAEAYKNADPSQLIFNPASMQNDATGTPTPQSERLSKEKLYTAVRKDAVLAAMRNSGTKVSVGDAVKNSASVAANFIAQKSATIPTPVSMPDAVHHTVQFKAPAGQSIQARFKPSDVSDFLKFLSDAGATTA